MFYKALANLKTYEWRGCLLPPGCCGLQRMLSSIAPSAHFANIPEPTNRTILGPIPTCELWNTAHGCYRLVAQLPEAQRRVVHERFVDQRSIREIAERLGKSEGAIKQLQLRALERLRAQLEGRHA